MRTTVRPDPYVSPLLDLAERGGTVWSYGQEDTLASPGTRWAWPIGPCVHTR